MHTPSQLRLPFLALSICALAFGAGRVFANQHQPHMQNALNALRTAHAELAEAERNKGGYRSNAQALVTQAITEVEAGIAFAGGY